MTTVNDADREAAFTAWEAIVKLGAAPTLVLNEAFARHRKAAERQALERAAGYIEGAGGVIPGASIFAGLIAGNSQPDMSGDMRNRLHPPQRRQFDSITRQLAQAIRALMDTTP